MLTLTRSLVEAWFPFACTIRANREWHLFNLYGDKVDPMETRGLTLMVNKPGLFCVSRFGCGKKMKMHDRR